MKKVCATGARELQQADVPLAVPPGWVAKESVGLAGKQIFFEGQEIRDPGLYLFQRYVEIPAEKKLLNVMSGGGFIPMILE